jgi:hypothetical protein
MHWIRKRITHTITTHDRISAEIHPIQQEQEKKKTGKNYITRNTKFKNEKQDDNLHHSVTNAGRLSVNTHIWNYKTPEHPMEKPNLLL